jgi:putative acyl-CoA dehydrogenase
LLALCLQASQLPRLAPASVVDTCCATRLVGDWGAVLGTLPGGTPVRALVELARVAPP